jgi:hypothetical protein
LKKEIILRLDNEYQKWYSGFMSNGMRLQVNFYKTGSGNEPVAFARIYQEIPENTGK